jgi:hypothetical protein
MQGQIETCTTTPRRYQLQLLIDAKRVELQIDRVEACRWVVRFRTC